MHNLFSFVSIKRERERGSEQRISKIRHLSRLFDSNGACLKNLSSSPRSSVSLFAVNIKEGRTGLVTYRCALKNDCQTSQNAQPKSCPCRPLWPPLEHKIKDRLWRLLELCPPFSDKHSFIHIYFSSLPLPEAFFAPELNPSFSHLLPFFSEVSSTPSSTLAGRQMSQPRKSWRSVSKLLKL